MPHCKCNECALVRHKFMLSDDQLADYYSTSYRKDYQRVSFGPTLKHVSKRAHEARSRLAKLEAYSIKNAKVLDFGCGSGEFVELMQTEGAISRGFEPGGLYASYAKEQKRLNVENCGWENYDCNEKMDLITSFHVFEHLTNPVKAFQKAVTWLEEDGLIYLEVPNLANLLNLKGFGSLHMAHTLGFGRYSLELLGACCGMKPVEVFDEFNIGIIFKRGQPRQLEEIKKNSLKEFSHINSNRVNNQFWRYSAAKIFGKRPKL